MAPPSPTRPRGSSAPGSTAEQRDAVMRDLFSARRRHRTELPPAAHGRQRLRASNGQLLLRRHAGRARPTRRWRSSRIDHDRAYIIPVLKQAPRLNPELTHHGIAVEPTRVDEDQRLDDRRQPRAGRLPAARRLLREVRPGVRDGRGSGPTTSAAERAALRARRVSRACRSAPSEQQRPDPELPRAGAARPGLDTEILAYDHNWDVISYPETMYADPARRGIVTGTAWHCYGGDVRAQAVSHNDYPNKPA